MFYVLLCLSLLYVAMMRAIQIYNAVCKILLSPFCGTETLIINPHSMLSDSLPVARLLSDDDFSSWCHLRCHFGVAPGRCFLVDRQPLLAPSDVLGGFDTLCRQTELWPGVDNLAVAVRTLVLLTFVFAVHLDLRLTTTADQTTHVTLEHVAIWPYSKPDNSNLAPYREAFSLNGFGSAVLTSFWPRSTTLDSKMSTGRLDPRGSGRVTIL